MTTGEPKMESSKSRIDFPILSNDQLQSLIEEALDLLDAERSAKSKIRISLYNLVTALDKEQYHGEEKNTHNCPTCDALIEARDILKRVK